MRFARGICAVCALEHALRADGRPHRHTGRWAVYPCPGETQRAVSVTKPAGKSARRADSTS